MLSWVFNTDASRFCPIDQNHKPLSLSELKREMGVDLDVIPHSNKNVNIDDFGLKISELNAECNVEPEVESNGTYKSNLADFSPLTKLEYQTIVKGERRTRVHALFSKELEDVSNQLRKQAMKMTNCRFEVAFDIIDTHVIGEAEILLRDYFIDLGFDVIVAERDHGRCVVLTLT